jgi:hypothetical protein
MTDNNMGHIGFKNHAKAHREFDASPARALTLICGLKKGVVALLFP